MVVNTHVHEQNIALIPCDAGFQLVLILVHLLEPLARDDLILFNTSELQIWSTSCSLGGLG